MNCGRLSAPNGARNGSGWLSIAKRAKLWAWRLGRGVKRPLANCGHRCQQSIANVPSAIPIFGRRMPPSCQRNGIVRLATRVARPIILSGSTTPCASVVVGWCAKHSRFRRRWPIISAPSGISYTTITHGNAPNVVPLQLHDYPICLQWDE